MAVVKVKADIIARIGRAVILVIRYVETFKTDVIDFIGNFIMCLTSH